MPDEVGSNNRSISIRGVVFDLDGLMLNTEGIFAQAESELLRRRGKELTSELRRQMMGRRAAESIAIMIEMHGLTESVEELYAESRKLFSSLLDDCLAPMPGLFELLDVLEDRQLPKAVATSSPRSYLEDMLNRFDLLDRFHTTLTAEDVTHGKPHPEIYLTAASRLGIQPAEMLVLEDSEAGSTAAAAAGAVVIAVPHEHSQGQKFPAVARVADSLIDPLVLQTLGSPQSTGSAGVD